MSNQNTLRHLYHRISYFTKQPLSTVVDEDRFSLLLNWTQHPPPSQNSEVGSFVVELSIDGGTTFEEVYLYTCIITVFL